MENSLNIVLLLGACLKFNAKKNLVKQKCIKELDNRNAGVHASFAKGYYM
jgi:hypothetical protein